MFKTATCYFASYVLSGIGAGLKVAGTVLAIAGDQAAEKANLLPKAGASTASTQAIIDSLFSSKGAN